MRTAAKSEPDSDPKTSLASAASPSASSSPFQKPAQSIAEMMRKLAFNTRLVFDYLRMTQNSNSARAQ